MPKVKVPRKSISLDMTAMCDMAFLLLTFFMLATKFKAPENVAVDIPSSISTIKLPEKDMMIISVASDGRIFFSLDGQPNRKELLDKMSGIYNIKFTESEKSHFALMENSGFPIHTLKGVLNLGKDIVNVNEPGIPCDSSTNELKDWILSARLVNPKARIAVKGDINTDYKVIERIIQTLQKQRINKFNLITSLEAKPID
ncbi:MAG: ExbD/TolR family protein [Cytophagaceae bacterium]